MPRYFFDIEDGRDVVDDEGEDLPDDRAARIAGLEALSQVLGSRVERFWDDERLTLTVRDAERAPLVVVEVRTRPA